MISVDCIMNALEHCKVRLPFFDTPCIIRFITLPGKQVSLSASYFSPAHPPTLNSRGRLWSSLIADMDKPAKSFQPENYIIIHKSKHLCHKTYKFGYVQNVKVFFFNLTYPPFKLNAFNTTRPRRTRNNALLHFAKRHRHF